MITIAMMMKMIGTMQEEIVVGVKNVVAERVIRAIMTIMIMITKRMTTIKIETVETIKGVVIVGEVNVVGERVTRTMMTITMITTGMMMMIKMEVMETVTGEVIVGENLVEENAARIVG
jgi:hypothetical protein